MIYDPIKAVALRILRAPSEPPAVPAGHHASARVFRASRRYLWCRLILLFGAALGVVVLDLLGTGILFVLPASIDFSDLEGWWTVLGGGLALAALVLVTFVQYLAVRIDYDMRYYIVTDRSLRIREGAWTIKEMTLTHANVQNLRVRQGPVQRLFGIWTLVVDTAGGGSGGDEGETGHTFEMAGVENAHEIRDLILGHLREHGRGSGLGDLDDHGERRPSTPGLTPRALEALGAVRDAARGLRQGVEGTGGGDAPDFI